MEPPVPASAVRALVLLTLVASCGRIGYHSATRDAGPLEGGRRDTGAIRRDAGRDGGADAGRDGGADAGLDDAGLDDAGLDDAGLDAGLDDAGLDDAGLDDAGLDDAGLDDAGLDDAGSGALPPYILATAQLTRYGGNSFVELEVDWAQRIAYLGSREPGVCLTVVDLADERRPTVLATFGAASTLATPGNRCLGLALYMGGRRLLISAEDAGRVTSWGLGVDPRALSFTDEGGVPVSTRPRKLAVVSDGRHALVARGGGGGGFQVLRISLAGDLALETGSYASGCQNNYVTSIGSPAQAMLGCWVDAAAVEHVDMATVARIRSFPMDNGGLSGLWTGAASADGRRVFQGGWVGAFFERGPSLPLRLTYRFDNEGAYRDAVFAADASRSLLYAVTAGPRFLEVWDATDVTRPTMITRSPMPTATGELYAVEVDSVRRRAVIVSNRGQLLVIDIDRLLPAGMTTWPVF